MARLTFNQSLLICGLMLIAELFFVVGAFCHVIPLMIAGVLLAGILAAVSVIANRKREEPHGWSHSLDAGYEGAQLCQVSWLCMKTYHHFCAMDCCKCECHRARWRTIKEVANGG